MPSPEQDGLDQHAADPSAVLHDTSANTDLSQLVAAAADLCRKPWRHAVLPKLPAESGLEPGEADSLDCSLKLEVRDAQGERLPEQDLELELYCSGRELNLTLGWCDEQRPLLWHGSHAVWMDGTSGERCSRPLDGMPLEALARRLRALLGGGAER